MKHRAVLWAMLGLLILTISACKDDDDFSVYYGYEYFPKEQGHYVIYNVDSVRIDTFFINSVDSFNYQVRELIDTFFMDAEGREACRIERELRADTNQPWGNIRIWNSTLTDTRAEKTEENLRYIKLIFPAKVGVKWQGNAFINTNTPDNEFLEGWEYEIIDIHQPKTINDLYFDSTITVLQVDNENLIDKLYSMEVYAANVGLVYKEFIQLKKKSSGNNIAKPFTDLSAIEKGTILRMSVIEYKQ